MWSNNIWFSDQMKGSKILVPTLSQLCACEHVCLCLRGPIWTLQSVKEAPAVLLFDKPLPKIDQIVSAACFPPMELEKHSVSVTSSSSNECLWCFSNIRSPCIDRNNESIWKSFESVSSTSRSCTCFVVKWTSVHSYYLQSTSAFCSPLEGI